VISSQRSRTSGIVSAIVFLLFVAIGFFADGVRFRLEAKDPSSLQPVPTGVPRLSNRVVLVVLDSVPIRVATDPQIMPDLVALAKRSASGVLIAPPQTTTTAGVRALAVGTKPSLRDTLAIFSHKPFPGWTVFDELVARGEPVAFYGDHVWPDLLGDRESGPGAPVRTDDFFADDDASLAAARQRLRSHDGTALVVLHISGTDFAAHQFGTQRPEYRDRLRQVDSDLHRFLDDVVDDGTTVIVTADHGCDLYGSHGGSADIYRRVPLVLAGAGVLPVHGFEIESRQMPLVLAILHGARMPGGILAPAPAQFLALDDAQRAQLALADLTRVQALASFHDVGVSSEVPAMLAAIDVSSRPDPGMLLWIGVLFLAMALVYLATVATVRGQTPAFAAVCILLAILGATSSVRLPILVAIAAVEAVLLAVAVHDLPGRQRIGACAALAGAVVVMIGSALRFMLSGAFLLSLARPVAAVAVVAIPAALWTFRARLRDTAAPLTGAALCAVPLILFTFGVFKPINLAPLLACGLLVLALRANRIAWAHVAWAAAALFVFFLLSQRIAFAWAGERVYVRYLYAGAAGAVLSAILAWKLEKARRWLLPALICLFLLWPFGFVTFGLAPVSGSGLGAVTAMKGNSRALSGAIQGSLTVLVVLASLAVAWRLRIVRACALPLIAVLVYQRYPGQASFYLALAAHLAGFAAIAARSADLRLKHLSTAGVAFSLLVLLSPPLDVLSVMLFCAALFLAASAPSGDLDDATLVLLAAFLFTCVRYGIVNSFGHVGGLAYDLNNVDTHSGFGAMNKDVALWVPTTLVVLKMVGASILAFALLLCSPRFRRLEGRIVLVSLAIVIGLLVQSSIEVALSFGRNEVRLSEAMIQVTFHGAIVVFLASGYAAYKLLVLRALPSTAPETSVKPVLAPLFAQ